MIGKTIAHYEITLQIGKGGMGEVYQATDKKLGRNVAVKVLPEEFAANADRIARFQREAKLLASLNHPGIAAVYGLEESGGSTFLVMELVEGETLADRISGGPIPVEESLKLALQIAEALESAHEKGVVHRDLKPANIKITPEGKVKILDFGLAKAFSAEQKNENLSNSPTLSVAATQQGVILGTAAYMSPEQAKGRSVDRRTDIWAFGCVLFEMLAGQAAFQGEDVTEILASVVKADVNLDLLPKNLNPQIRKTIGRCLQKDLKKRFRDIGDVAFEIEHALADPDGMSTQSPGSVMPAEKRHGILSWIAAVILIAAAAGFLAWNLKSPEAGQVFKSYYDLPDNQVFSNALVSKIDISPDGTMLAYSTPEGIYLKSMDEWAPRLLEQTEGALLPVFSPDGESIGFVSEPDGKLKRIAVTGGAPKELGTVGISSGMSWTEDNRILEAGGPEMEIISGERGDWEKLYVEEGLMMSAPQMLPGGESVLYTLRDSTSVNKIMVRSLDKGESEELFEGSYARYVKTGHIIYGLGNNLYAVSFDKTSLKVTGNPEPVVEDVMHGAYTWHYAVSDSGTLLYIPDTGGTQDQYSTPRTPVWVDLNGNMENLSIESDSYNLLKVSPDGDKVAFTVGGASDSKIHIWDDVRKDRYPFTPDSFGACPLWTTNGKQIVFMALGDDGNRIHRKAASGVGKSEPIGSEYGKATHPFPTSWSRDGKTLVFMGFSVPERIITYDIGTISMEEDGSYRPLLNGKYVEAEAKISPDGEWMVYTYDESGQSEIYLCPYPDIEEGSHIKVSTNGGYSPLWSPDSREVYFRNGDAVMAVNVKTIPLEKPRRLFQGNYFPQRYNFLPVVQNSWDIDPDGTRFLMLKPVDTMGGDSTENPPRRIHIIQNWFEELKKKVPIP